MREGFTRIISCLRLLDKLSPASLVKEKNTMDCSKQPFTKLKEDFLPERSFGKS